MDNLGLKGTNANRVANYSELGSAFESDMSDVIANRTIATLKAAIQVDTYTITGIIIVTVQGLGILKII